MNQSTIVLKPYSVKEIATVFSVSDRTIKKWIEPFEPEIGRKQGRYYTVLQVKMIFEKLGVPGKILQED